MSKQDELKRSITTLDTQRAILGDAVVDNAIAALQAQLAAIKAAQPPDKQRRQVTILFMDVVGSTRLVQNLDPEDNLAIMDNALRRLAEAVTEHGGFVTRFMGDGFMALFGMEKLRENDPEMGVRAGLSILKKARLFAQDLQKEQGISGFSVRVGINTGPVVTGMMGSGPSVDYTAMGDAVNLAAWLEETAPPGNLLIGHNTYRQVRGLFDVQALEPQKIKEQGDLIPIYLVKRAKSRAFRKGTRGVEGIETRMIGREEELQRIQEAFQTTIAANKRQVVTIVGEAGVGKSRLLFEFDNWAELRPDEFFFFKGRSTLETQPLPLALIRDLFSFRFQIQDSDRSTAVQEKMERGIGDVLQDDQAEMKAHIIGHLLGFDFTGSRHLQGLLDDGQQIHSRALIYLTEYFQALAAESPVLILLEDLHWADDSSLDLIDRLTLAIAERPLFVVGAGRPDLYERRPDWGGGGDPPSPSALDFHICLALSPLSEQESAQLVDELLQKVEEIPADLCQLIVNTADGNPFFVEELIKVLIDDGVINKTETSWTIELERLRGLRVPPTLTGILQTRLGSLEDKERIVLQQAAVVGRKFWESALMHINERIADIPESDHVTTILANLERKEMVFRRNASAFANTHEYIFKHALLREVAYQSVLNRVRLNYHKLVADWLIEHSGERADELTGLIAEHLEFAEDGERASTYLRQAGDQAAARFANIEAVGYYRRALSLLPAGESSRRINLILAQEKIYDVLGNREAQEEKIAECEQLVIGLKSADRLPLQVEIALRRAAYAEAVSAFPEAITASQAAIDLAKQINNTPLEASGHLRWGRSLWKQGAYEESHAQLEQALALARSAAALPEIAGSLLNLGNVNAMQGDLIQAQVYYQESLPLYRAIKHYRGEGAALGNLGNTYGYQGQIEQAIHYYELALALAQKTGDRHNEGTWLGNLSIDYKNLGQFGKAMDYCRRALTIARQIGDLRNVVIWLSTEGDIHQTLGQFSAAIEVHRQALELSRQIGDRTRETRILSHLGYVALQQGSYQEAKNYFDRALPISKDSGDRDGEAYALQGLGNAWLGLKYPGEASKAFQLAVGIWREIDLPYAEIESLAGLARVEMQKGLPLFALSHVEDILEYLEDNNLAGSQDPYQIYLTCYQVLQANYDLRAGEVLFAAYTLLQSWGDNIADDETRYSFLNNVPSHRDIVREYTKTAH